MCMASVELMRGALELAVLEVVSHETTYGFELLATLRSSGFPDVADPSVYGVLRRLEASGKLTSELIASPSGAARRYYRLTNSGHTALERATVEWDALVRAMAGIRIDRTKDEQR